MRWPLCICFQAFYTRQTQQPVVDSWLYFIYNRCTVNSVFIKYRWVICCDKLLRIGKTGLDLYKDFYLAATRAILPRLLCCPVHFWWSTTSCEPDPPPLNNWGRKLPPIITTGLLRYFFPLRTIGDLRAFHKTPIPWRRRSTVRGKKRRCENFFSTKGLNTEKTESEQAACNCKI